MLRSFVILVDAIVYEAKLGSFESVLEFRRERLCKACNQAIFCNFFFQSLMTALFVSTKPSKHQHSVFEEVRAEHLLEKFY